MKAFLSYSSLDEDLARRIATDLQSNGIDVWFAGWSLAPGDSLRRKIEAGIDGARFFFVLLTGNSLASKWVQEEIDLAFVKKVEGKCRFIPLVHGVAAEKVPLTLRAVVWVRLEPYEEQLKHLVTTCFNIPTAPPLGEGPTWSRSGVAAAHGISPLACELATVLCRTSEHGLSSVDPLVEPREVMHLLGCTEDDLEEVATELEDRGLVTVHRAVGGVCVRGIRGISPENQLFVEFDEEVHGWSPEKDAHALACAAVNAGEGTHSTKALMETLGWTTRRINPATAWLVRNDLALESKTLSYPFEQLWILPTARTRRFARTGDGLSREGQTGKT